MATPKTLLFSAALLLAGLVACTPEATQALSSGVLSSDAPSVAYVHSYNLPSHGVALEGYCPVAYFAVNKPVRGKPEHSALYDDVTYHFVSADARDAFIAEPQKYVPAFGGWCAFGMAVEDKFPVDPTSFKIVDGQLMVFLKNPGVDARAIWNDGNEKELKAKAAAHWASVRG